MSRARREADSEHDRPTIVPDFDPESFARDSEIKQRVSAGAGAEPTIDRARRLCDDGEYEQALFLLTSLLDLAPLHPEASRLAADCRAGLERQCLTALGSVSTVLVAGVPLKDLTSFALDNVSAFLFSLVDGATSVENILDSCGLPRLLALRHMRHMTERGVLVVASTRRRMPGAREPGAMEPRSADGGLPSEREADEVAIDSQVLAVAVGGATLDAVPILLVLPEDLEALEIDAATRVLIARVNETATLDEILTATRTSIVDGLATFERLAESGVVTFV